MLELTEESLKAAKFKGPTAFYDGAKGMAQQDFECVDEPRFGYAWRRENSKDRGRQFFMVDGKEVADLAEASRLLALPEDPDSPRACLRRIFEESKASPRLNYGASSALNQAQCNASAAPFGTVRAWLQRSDNAWHGAINDYSDSIRDPENPSFWPRWLYNAKHSMHETYRGMYLFEHDRKEDTGLKCALGKKCRACPILQTIERSMIESRERRPFPSAVEDSDIDAAKVATCIGHILQTDTGGIVDGGFWSRRDDRP